MSMPDEELNIEPSSSLTFLYPFEVDSSRQIRIKNESKEKQVVFKLKATKKIFKARKGGAWGVLDPLAERTIKIYFRPQKKSSKHLPAWSSQKHEIVIATMYPPKDFLASRDSISKLFRTGFLSRCDPESPQKQTIALPCEHKITVHVNASGHFDRPKKAASLPNMKLDESSSSDSEE